MNEQVVETSTLFNKDKEELFKEEGATQRFLEPVDLYNHFPSQFFSSDLSNLSDEKQFFEALHFVRYRLAQAIQHHQERDNSQRVEYWYKLATILRNRITSANMGLIYGCMKRTCMSLDSDTMLSAGSAALLRAVEKYNPWFGNKFSTYACRSILHRFSSHAKKRDWTGYDIADLEPQEIDSDEDVELRKDRVQAAIKLAELTTRERNIILLRFYKGERLVDVGETYNLSKERIRQIQIKALDKIRSVLEVDPALNS